jgi:hypothetical protein
MAAISPISLQSDAPEKGDDLMEACHYMTDVSK